MINQSNKEKVLNALKNKNLVKIISGIQNYDKQKTLNVAMAAEMGGATGLDICDESEIIKTVRASVQLPLFVSSIDSKKLLNAQDLGADVLEIGNYESFYKEDKMFTQKEIREIVKSVKKSLDENVLLCCTIPATLEIENQVKLAKELLDLGVDILQSEGFSPDTPVSDRKDKTFNDILKSASTLANTIELRKALPNAHIICASGITNITVPLALAVGASGIGIGTYINSLLTQVEMEERVREVVESINQFVPQYLQTAKSLALQV